MSNTFDDLRLGLVREAVIESDASRTVTISTTDASLRLGPLSPARRAALRDLAAGPLRVGELAERVLAQEGLTALSLFYSDIGRLRRMGLLIYRLETGGRPLATCTPQSRMFALRRPDATAHSYLLSRFAYLRREGRELALESSAGLGRLTIHDPDLLGLVARLAAPCTLEALRGAAPQLGPAQLDLLLQMLWSSGALTACDAEGAPVEDRQDNLRQWEFHDLLFHRLSRGGRHRNLHGATERFAGALDQPPRLKYYPAEAERVPLELPSAEAIRQSDLPLDRALEQRRSIRTPGRPLTLAQLSTFLYRSARVRFPTQTETRAAGGPPTPEPPAYLRPYPGGGARYELELYLSVHRCDGLEPGLYHYQPLEHALARVRPYDRLVQGLLRAAAQSALADEPPDVLITLAACFQRMTWRYQSMAYAAILKDVGVLYQTMYLVATAMRLAPCGLGYGNAALFAAAAGTDFFVESSVGEFVLSGGPPDPEPAG
jgi:SagB-type dehydrogenase family enzyme